MAWQERTLGEICDAAGGVIKTGPFGSQLHQSDYSDIGIPVVMPKDIINGHISEQSIARISYEHVERLAHHKLQPGNIVYGRRGDIGRCAFVTAKEAGWLCGTGCLRIHLPKGDVYSKFLFNYLNHPQTINWISNQAIGATMPNLNTGILRSVPISYPDYTAQLRIASILSAYDDLIENNTRRIAILEEMARRLYEEWFVHFRFPGHEHARFKEMELGRIPEGWSIKLLGEIVEHHVGGGWGSDAPSDDFPVAAHVIRGTDIPDVRKTSLGRSPIRFHTTSNFRTRKLFPGDIVFEVSGGSKDQPVGRSVLLNPALFKNCKEPIICASFCRLVRANSSILIPELLQLHFERIYGNREIMKYQTQSTGITNFRFSVFLEKEQVLIPSSEVQESFNKFAAQLYGLAASLGLKNINLRAQRDLLLPKLVSGELDVSNLPLPDLKEDQAA